MRVCEGVFRVCVQGVCRCVGVLVVCWVVWCVGRVWDERWAGIRKYLFLVGKLCRRWGGVGGQRDFRGSRGEMVMSVSVSVRVCVVTVM